jgi:hypothetical protein
MRYQGLSRRGWLQNFWLPFLGVQAAHQNICGRTGARRGAFPPQTRDRPYDSAKFHRDVVTFCADGTKIHGSAECGTWVITVTRAGRSPLTIGTCDPEWGFGYASTFLTSRQAEDFNAALQMVPAANPNHKFLHNRTTHESDSRNTDAFLRKD